jgi:hypothetical protein
VQESERFEATDETVKYLASTISAAALLAALAFIGTGYLNTRRSDRKAGELRTAVHSMTQQELAAAIARCDAPPQPAGRPTGAPRRDAAYCEDVAREMDDRPLEIVERKIPAPRVP